MFYLQPLSLCVAESTIGSDSILGQKLGIAAAVFAGCVVVIVIAVCVLLRPGLPAFMTSGRSRREREHQLMTTKDGEQGNIGTPNPMDLDGC